MARGRYHIVSNEVGQLRTAISASASMPTGNTTKKGTDPSTSKEKTMPDEEKQKSCRSESEFARPVMPDVRAPRAHATCITPSALKT
jgi:hypothetical protein